MPIYTDDDGILVIDPYDNDVLFVRTDRHDEDSSEQGIAICLIPAEKKDDDSVSCKPGVSLKEAGCKALIILPSVEDAVILLEQVTNCLTDLCKLGSYSSESEEDEEEVEEPSSATTSDTPT